MRFNSDSTWGDVPNSCVSQLGYLCYLHGLLISWSSARQRCVTYSSTKAKLDPLVDSFQEGVWLKAVISDLWVLNGGSASHFVDNASLHSCLTINDKDFKAISQNVNYIDNKGLDDKLKKFGSNPKTQHIDLKTKGLCQEVKNATIKIVLI